MNIDKDKEILKEFIKEVQEEYEETSVDGKVYRIENISIEFKPTKELAKSIENVLKELEIKNNIINNAIHEIEVLRKYFADDLQPDFIRILEILKNKKVIDW